MSTCKSLEGNSDFYGLGIRIGIYLQWGSAWLSLLLDPESAQGVLDANSVSLFAVAIATVIAASRDAPAIEMYIMLQILLGFPVTTLSSFGFRLWLMSPRRLDKLRSEMSRLWREHCEKRREAARQREQRKGEARQRREHRRQELQRRRDQRRVDANRSAFENWLSDVRDAVLMPQEGWDSWEEREEEPRRERQQRHELLQQRRPQQRASAQNPRWWNWVLEGAVVISRMAFPTSVPSDITVHVLYILWHLPVLLPVRLLSSLKFPGLSWSGVLWRSTTVALLMGYNLAYWFDEGGHGVQEPPSPGCGPPTVFMFSMQPLGGPIVTLGRVAAVIISVIVGIPTFVLLILTLRIFVYALLFLYRDAYFFVTSGDPQSFKDILDRVNNVLGHRTLAVTQTLESYSSILPFVTITGLQTMAGMERSLLDLLEFMSAYGDDSSIRFSDVIKVGVSLGMGKPVKRQSQARDSEPSVSRAQTMSAGWRIDHLKISSGSSGRSLTLFCVAWNVSMVLSIAWFITSIETTIRWNNIQGVHSIDSTGQLIPFVIGCRYPDWVDTELEIQDGADGPLIWEIVKRSGGDANSVGGPRAGTTTGTTGGNATAGNDPNQGAIALANLSQGSSQSAHL
ncbi:hypothetical protein QBC33DRAFT_515387 [Phialemonium atrogriseum]|uniref:Uncharacterized protein n=1 Tax=Phialemonium atrogriseum TaxID=1093897 RepID=A0AAJ0C3Z9_9PEZI|nr:uncharacterized protein QBC33DRAFT_515387 [Phialemonium atrogriseum]KAK1767226.1 hypothetical protein QBC33DRAFT_515387 [Phialemonium atrogriseum]